MTDDSDNVYRLDGHCSTGPVNLSHPAGREYGEPEPLEPSAWARAVGVTVVSALALALVAVVAGATIAAARALIGLRS